MPSKRRKATRRSAPRARWVEPPINCRCVLAEPVKGTGAFNKPPYRILLLDGSGDLVANLGPYTGLEVTFELPMDAAYYLSYGPTAKHHLYLRGSP